MGPESSEEEVPALAWLGGISSPDLGELRDWWLFLFRDGQGFLLKD